MRHKRSLITIDHKFWYGFLAFLAVTGVALASTTITDSYIQTGNFTVNSTGLFVNNTVIQMAGNVGIGTTSPNYLLSLGSNLGDKLAVYDGGAGSIYGFGIQAGRMYIKSANNEVMNILSTGNVGIGTTNPVYLLDVRGRISSVSAADNGGVIILGNSTYPTGLISAAEAASNLTIQGSNGIFFNTYSGSWGERMRISSAGNVGIGTISPSSKLDIYSASGNTRLRLGTVAVGGDIMSLDFYGANGGVVPVYSRVSGIVESGGIGNEYGGLGFSTINNGGLGEKMRITSAGNVGIGTTSPQNKLNIEGSGNALNISNGASCSYIAAGSTSFTACSSRDIKENIKPFAVDNILGRIASVPVNTYGFRNCTSGGCKNNLGLIAEDFQTVLNRGDGKTVNGQDVQMALWLAAQELIKENKELDAKNMEQQKEIGQLKSIVCLDHPLSQLCN